MVYLLEKLPGYHKTLVNVYLPKEKGSTIEIDVLFLHDTGIYVFESKNYSAWVLWNNADKNWIQSFLNGKKHSFYNPINQNLGQIKALTYFISAIQNEYMISFIAFSERCELKKNTVTSPDFLAVKRNHLKTNYRHQR